MGELGGGGGLRWGVWGGIACGDASWVSLVTSASGLAFPESALGLGPPSLGRSSYQEQTGTVVSCEPWGMRLAWERRGIVVDVRGGFQGVLLRNVYVADGTT